MSGRHALSRRQFLKVAGGTATVLAAGTTLPLVPYATADLTATDPPLTILAYNENPFGMFPLAREAVVAAAGSGNRYAKETADTLRDSIARDLFIDAEQVVLGAGSIEPLKIAV